MKVTVDFEECLKDSPRFRCRRERAGLGWCGGTGRGEQQRVGGREAGLGVRWVTGRAAGPGLWGPRRVTDCGQPALRRVAGWAVVRSGYVGQVGDRVWGAQGGGCGGRCGGLWGGGGSRDRAGLCGAAGGARGPGCAGAARCGGHCWVTASRQARAAGAAGAGSARQPQPCLLGLQSVNSPVVRLRFFRVVFTPQLPVSPARICCMRPYSVCPLNQAPCNLTSRCQTKAHLFFRVRATACLSFL